MTNLAEYLKQWTCRMLPIFQNSCNSLQAFNPDFKTGSMFFVFEAILNKRPSSLLCLSIIFVLPSIKFVQVDRKSDFLLILRGNDDMKEKTMTNIKRQYQTNVVH